VKNTKLLCLAAAALLSLGAAVSSAGQKKTSARPEEQDGQQAVAPATTGASTAGATTTTDIGVAASHYFYEFEQPEFVVSHIQIEHDGAGRGRVKFVRKSDAEPITEPLELSPSALQRVVAFWESLRFLETETNYQSEKQFPHLGTSRLRMARGGRERAAEFNWTRDPNASALVNEYRRVADQALFVFEINLAREIQPLDSPKLISRLDTLLDRKALSDPKQLLPLLRDLSIDERLPLIARNHAGRLLKKIEK
jgi:hypothetical protein